MKFGLFAVTWSGMLWLTTSALAAPAITTEEFVIGPGVYSDPPGNLSLTPVSGDLAESATSSIASGGFHFATNGDINNFDDGIFDADPLTVILNDNNDASSTIGEGEIVLQYDWASAVNIDEIRLFGGHNEFGGRAWIEADVYAQIDGTSTYTLILGKARNWVQDETIPGSSTDSAVGLVVIGDDGAGTLVSNIDSLRIEFFAVNRNNVARDRSYDAGDNIAYGGLENTILKEIDILGSAATSVESWTLYR